MRSLNVTVPSSTGVLMAGTIDQPSHPAEAYAIFAHCFAGSRYTPAASRVSKHLAEHGIATLRFDFPGLGQSGGEFSDTTFSQNVDDIVAAATWLGGNYRAPQLIVGHSLGGAAALKAATRDEMQAHLKAVVAIGSPFDPAHSVHHFTDRISEIQTSGSATVTLGGQELTLTREYLLDLTGNSPAEYLPQLRTPLLLLHSPSDATVGIDNAEAIFAATHYPKSLIALDNADHLLTQPESAQRTADLIVTWARQHLASEFTPEPTTETNAISYSARGTRFGDIVRTSDRAIVTDRAMSSGGKGQGVTPTGLFMSALAASTSQAVREAGRSMGLVDVRVEVTHLGGTDFTREITVSGTLSDDQRAALLAAATASPIDAFSTGCSFQTTLR
ncbi:alpha/beta fold hydrolase [Corynebacterium sp. LK2510]|uniref:bifunctional alpha/beta hydrolase/OsmC family protein n=1 Tax=Corynebacterium sp. LK2510 TaxID=3110472 RepID=UPI0034D0102E